MQVASNASWIPTKNNIETWEIYHCILPSPTKSNIHSYHKPLKHIFNIQQDLWHLLQTSTNWVPNFFFLFMSTELRFLDQRLLTLFLLIVELQLCQGVWLVHWSGFYWPSSIIPLLEIPYYSTSLGMEEAQGGIEANAILIIEAHEAATFLLYGK